LLDLVNTACVREQVPFLPVVLLGWEGHIGPAYFPQLTACYHCYDLRVKSNLSHYQQYLLYEEACRRRPGEQPFGRLATFPDTLAGLASTEVTKIITSCYPPATYGRLVVIDLLMLETEVHDVVKVPRCPTCGGGDASLPSAE
jgi:bacteriocin biosynthesis cyclodehydratase domain-containing protein